MAGMSSRDTGLPRTVQSLAGFRFAVGLSVSANVFPATNAAYVARFEGSLFALIVPAGLMLFSAHPHEFVDNTIFLLKLGLIALAAVNALVFHRGIYRSVNDWNTGVTTPVPAQFHAAVSMVAWVAVISCGRLLAYT